MKNNKKKEIREPISSPSVNYLSRARSWKPRVINTPEQARAIGRQMATDVAKKLKLKLTA